MNTTIKIIRAYWGDSEKTKAEIPPIPIYSNQLVYVWGKENEQFLQKRGYKTRLVTEEDPCLIDHTNFLFKKLITLDLALKEHDEIIFLDWDCYILRELDNNFYNLLKSKPIQCPLYSHSLNPYESFLEFSPNNNEERLEFFKNADIFFKKYNWQFEDMLVLPNFGCFYSRDKSIGNKLLNIALENNLKGCVDEGAMFIYANCSLNEYVENYHPLFIQGVSDNVTGSKYYISTVQRKFNEYLKNKLSFDLYLEHE